MKTIEQTIEDQFKIDFKNIVKDISGIDLSDERIIELVNEQLEIFHA